jgi:hypothetical protein
MSPPASQPQSALGTADSGGTKTAAREKEEVPFTRQPPVLRPAGRLARALGQELLIGLLVLLLLFLVAWYSTPYFLRDYLNKRGAELPDYHLNINWVEIHPWNCSLDLIDLTLTKKSGEIPVPFYRGPDVHIALQWSRVLHADFLSSITLTNPVVNFVQGPTEAQSQTFLEPEWVTTVKKLVPFQINRFQVIHGDLHFRDFHAEPEIDLEMNHVELVADNLTNATHSQSLMPSTVVMSGNPFIVGRLNAELAVNVDLKQPTFSEKLRLDNIPAVGLNSFLAKYGSVYAKSGTLDFYTEMVSEKGSFDGYVKPYFQNLKFEPVPKDRGTLAAIWASIANGLKDLVTNDQGVVATEVPVKGSYQDPDVDFWSASFGILKNAYLQALAKGFDTPELAPSPTQTAKEPGPPPVPPPKSP